MDHGCCCGSEPIYKEDCFFYRKVKDMGMNFPYCGCDERRNIECRCINCTYYIDVFDAEKVVHDYVKNKAAASTEKQEVHCAICGKTMKVDMDYGLLYHVCPDCTKTFVDNLKRSSEHVGKHEKRGV